MGARHITWLWRQRHRNVVKHLRANTLFISTHPTIRH